MPEEVGVMMPIRKELRHLYRGKAWAGIRARILDREGHRCARCQAPNRTTVLRDGVNWWTGAQEAQGFRRVHVVLTIAHLNHDARDNREENLAALCQWCHLDHDRKYHAANARETRRKKKDAARPLLTMGEAAKSSGVGSVAAEEDVLLVEDGVH